MTAKQVCAMFWSDHPTFRRVYGRDQNDYPTDVRAAFCEYVDWCAREGLITPAVAERVTLK